MLRELRQHASSVRVLHKFCIYVLLLSYKNIKLTCQNFQTASYQLANIALIRTLQCWFEFKDVQDNTKPGIKTRSYGKTEISKSIRIQSSFEPGLVEEFPL